MSDIKEATQDFNPRLREGGDPMEENGMSLINISIHASEKEATRMSVDRAELILISIHASEKEATHGNPKHQQSALDFNPRLREGGDYLMHMVWLYEKISIHASEKEATLLRSSAVMI